MSKTHRNGGATTRQRQPWYATAALLIVHCLVALTAFPASAGELGDARGQSLRQQVEQTREEHGPHSPAHGKALARLAQFHIRRGEPHQALAELERLLDKVGGDAALDEETRRLTAWLRRWNDDLRDCKGSAVTNRPQPSAFRLVPQTAVTGRGLDEVSAISPAGERRVVARGSQLWIQDLTNGAVVRRLHGVPGPSVELAISSQGERLASVHPTAGSACIALWDLGTGERLGTMSAPLGKVTDLRFFPDGSGLVAAVAEPPAADRRQWQARHSLMAVWALTADGPRRRYIAPGSQFLTAEPTVEFLPQAPAVGTVSDLTTDWFAPDSGELWGRFSTSDWLRLARRTEERLRAFAADLQSGRVAVGTPKGVSVIDPANQTLVVSMPCDGTCDGSVEGALSFSPDGRFLLWGDRVWRVPGGGVVEPPERIVRFFNTWANDGTVVSLTGSDGSLARWSPDTGEVRRRVPGRERPMRSGAVRFSPDGARLRLASGLWQPSIADWDLSSLRATSRVREPASGGRGREASSAGAGGRVGAATATAVVARPETTQVLLGDSEADVRLHDRATGERLGEYAGLARYVSAVAATRDGRVLAAAEGPSWADVSTQPPPPEACVWRADDAAPTHRLSGHTGAINALALSDDGRRLASGGSRYLWIHSLASEEPQRLWQRELGGATALAFSDEGERLIAALPQTPTGHGGRVVVFDWAADRIVARLAVGQRVEGIDVAPERPLMAMSLADGSVRLWNFRKDHTATLVTGAPRFSYIDGWGPAQWVAYTEDGFFTAARGGTAFVRARLNGQSIPLDQFGLLYNRPDIILERLGLGTHEMVDHYRALHQWRAERAGLQSTRPGHRRDLPEVEVVEHTRDARRVRIVIEAAGGGSPLLDHQVYVNGVAQLDDNARVLDGDTARATHVLNLSSGENVIEVSARNRAGLESARARLKLKGPQPRGRDLYYLAIGVSDYQRDDLDLGFAHQDARDMAAYLDARGDWGPFDNVHGRVITDADATAKGVREAGTVLADADVDDTVVVFVAGHGLHARDRRARFYFLTHEADPQNLAETAVPYHFLERLLQRSPARDKLLLIDACESGERPPGAYTSAVRAGDEAEGIRDRGAVALTSRTTDRKPRPFLHQRERYIYRDLSRASGAVVFSSSTGSELSYESARLRNGFFTEALLEVLPRAGAFDRVREQVRARVAEWSQGRQHPVVDRDNPFAAIRFHSPPE